MMPLLLMAGIIVLSAIATDVGTLEHFPGMNLVRSAALVVQMYAFVPHRI